jgi:hypothetical protein
MAKAWRNDKARLLGVVRHSRPALLIGHRRDCLLWASPPGENEGCVFLLHSNIITMAKAACARIAISA